MPFHLSSAYKPSGDQPKAIDDLAAGLTKGFKKQTLLGVTGSGKTFTMANVIARVQKPTLVIAHNKTLAAQLCNEFREFFPKNAVEYFVSYYDYYQPEAYMPGSDTYIEKEAQVNEEIDRLRHACTQALLTRDDVIIVASVSAIYGLGSPKEYEKIVLHLNVGDELDRRGMMERLIEMQFERTNSDLRRGTFRMHGQIFEIMPVNEEFIYRFEIGNRIERIDRINPVTRKSTLQVQSLEDAWFFPAKHYVASPEARERAFSSIKQELAEQLAVFEKQGKVLEYERLKRRVSYDLEMIKNLGYCNGIENYSRHFEGRAAGEPSFTLLDYFLHSSGRALGDRDSKNGGIASLPLAMTENGGGYLTIIDESHVTIPQLQGMYNGDRARKDTLVEHGFRLPSARDNRPLRYEEFEARTEQVVYVSATPSKYEIGESAQVVEQVVRPTGLVDPEVIVKPITPGHTVIARRDEGMTKQSPKPTSDSDGKVSSDNEGIASSSAALRPRNDGESSLSQIDDLLIRIQERIKINERILVTTLTKKMAEDLTEFLQEKKIKVKYLHSDIDTIERIEVITDLRLGKIDVIVGVNLLREGLDMPEVSLVAILDADKEGFLRSETSLIQTIGRAARNVNGQVVLYADEITGSMERAIKETERRRAIQLAYNKEHGITPKTIQKAIRNMLEEFGLSTKEDREIKTKKARSGSRGSVTDLDILGDNRPLKEIIKDKENQMKEAAQKLEFELAAILRDELRELRAREKSMEKSGSRSKQKGAKITLTKPEDLS